MAAMVSASATRRTVHRPPATETFADGDVVTLEPGLYVPNVGGVRIENNYLIGATTAECLSRHRIGPDDR